MAQQQQQPMVDHKREPCPDRILNDIGGAFAMGALGGGVWHLIKGSKNSPSGYRVRGAIEVRGFAIQRCRSGKGAGQHLCVSVQWKLVGPRGNRT